MYEERLLAAIEGAGLTGEFAKAAKKICETNISSEEDHTIALCLVAQEIRNLALHVSSLTPSRYPGKR